MEDKLRTDLATHSKFLRYIKHVYFISAEVAALCVLCVMATSMLTTVVKGHGTPETEEMTAASACVCAEYSPWVSAPGACAG